MQFETLTAVFDGDVSRLNMAARDAERIIDNLEKRTNGFKGTLKFDKSGLSDLKSNLLGSFGGNLAAEAVAHVADIAKQGASVWLDYSANLEQTKVGFTTLLGSSQAAEAHLKDLQTFAKTTPFEFSELAAASRRFQGVGVEASKVIPILEDIGNAAAAAGASSEQLKLITVAFGQIISRGKLSAEEVGQLADHGIPAWQILSKEIGKSQAEVMKMAEAGQISSDVFLTAFQKFSQQNYGDAMQKQSRTFNGALSNITDSLLQVSNTAFAPLFDQISKFAVDFADEISAQGDDFEAVGEVMAKYIGKGLGIAVKEIAKGIGSILAKELTNYGKDSILDTAGHEFGNEIFDGLQYATNYLFNSGTAYEEEKKDIERWRKQRSAEFYGTQNEKSKESVNDIKKSLSDIKNTANSLPDLAGQLKAAEAEKETKKLQNLISELNLEIAFYGESSKESSIKQKLLKDGISDFNSDLAKSAISLARHLDALERFKAVGKTIDDLKQKIQFFGDETEVAATKQKLLAYGITDFTVGSAQAALSYAAQLDALKSADELREKVKDLRDEIVKTGQDARFEIEFPDATEMDKFNRWIRDNAGAFRELAPEIAKTRQELKLLAFDKDAKSRGEAVTDYLDNLRESLRGLKDATGAIDENLDFEKIVENLVKPLDLSKAVKPVSAEDFAKNIKDLMGYYRSALRNEKATAAGIIGDPDVINAELEKRLNTIRRKYYNFIQEYLSDFQKKGENGTVLNIFGDSKDFENVEALIDLWNSVKDARDRAFEKGKTDFGNETTDARLDAEREYIESMKAFGIQRESIRQAEYDLEKQREDRQHKLKIKELQKRRDELVNLAQFEEGKLAIAKIYNQQIEAENLRHDSVLSQIHSNFGDRSISDRMQSMIGELPGYGEQIKDFFGNLPTAFGDMFAQGLQSWDGTWQGFLQSLRQSFTQLLQELAAQMLRSAIIKLMTNLLGSAFGGSFGGGSSFGGAGAGGGWDVPGLASGGTAFGGMAHIVGERGPEIFVPGKTGTVINNRDTQKLLAQNGGSGNTTINFMQTIHAPRGLVSPKSRQQTADATLSGIGRLTRK